MFPEVGDVRDFSNRSNVVSFIRVTDYVLLLICLNAAQLLILRRPINLFLVLLLKMNKRALILILSRLYCAGDFKKCQESFV